MLEIYLKEKLSVQDEQELDKIILLAIKYYKKFILPHIKKRKPDTEESIAIKNLLQEIKGLGSEVSSEDYQNIVYKVGKEIYPKDLRKWFISLYQILFGSNSGPRLGSFFYVYGKKQCTISFRRDN